MKVIDLGLSKYSKGIEKMAEDLEDLKKYSD